MKARDLRWFLAGYATLLLIAMVVRSDDLIGVNLSWGNGEYSYRAGSAPWAVAFAIVGIGLYVALTVGRVDASARPLPDLFRRWAAGMTDFVTAMMVWGPFIGLVALAAEYKRTGAFDWLIERQEYQPGDWLAAVVPVLLLMFVALPAYFALAWRLGKPTPGSCIFGFRILPDEGSRLPFWKAWCRAMLGAISLLGWPCWILAYWVVRDKDRRKFWLDVIFKTHAEFLE